MMATIATTQPKNHNRSTSTYQNDSSHETRKGNGNENGMSISMQSLPQARKTKQQHQHEQNPPIPSEELQPRIRILTHNIWALKHLSPYQPERLTHIAHLIAISPKPPDIICLQECWTYPNYALLRRLLSPLYRHGKFYHSGCFGGGLVILSKWRIVETEMVPYALNGRPSAFWRGDWFVGKGVAVARIALPRKFCRRDDDAAQGRYLEVFNTHLHAPYNEGKEGKDTYSVHRVAQAWQIARMMRHALERGSLVVACGDFNMSPGGIECAVIQHQTRGLMRDVWQERFPDSSWGAWIEERERERLRELSGKEGVGKGRTGPPTVEETLLKHGHTCDSVFNTWRWEKRAQRDLLKKGIDRVVGLHEEDPRAKRLDYVFFGDGSNTRGGVGSRDGNGEWTVKEASISMTERHPDLKCSLSDHFAVETEIAWTTTPGRIRDEQNGDTITPIDKPLSSYPLHMPKILTLLTAYTTRQRTHRRRRCIHFLASVVITLSCFVAVWFSPANYVSCILLVLSSLGLMAGTVDGLIGLLFGGWELRALKEWEGEVRRGIRGGMGMEMGFEGGEVGNHGLDGVGDEDGSARWQFDRGEEVEMSRVKDWWS